MCKQTDWRVGLHVSARWVPWAAIVTLDWWYDDGSSRVGVVEGLRFHWAAWTSQTGLTCWFIWREGRVIALWSLTNKSFVCTATVANWNHLRWRASHTTHIADIQLNMFTWANDYHIAKEKLAATRDREARVCFGSVLQMENKNKKNSASDYICLRVHGHDANASSCKYQTQTLPVWQTYQRAAAVCWYLARYRDRLGCLALKTPPAVLSGLGQEQSGIPNFSSSLWQLSLPASPSALLGIPDGFCPRSHITSAKVFFFPWPFWQDNTFKSSTCWTNTWEM